MTDITSNERTVELSIAEKYLPKLESLRKYWKSEMDRLNYTANTSGVVEYLIDHEYGRNFGGYHDVEDFYTDRKIRVIVKKGNRTVMEDFEWEDFMPWFKACKENGNCGPDDKYRGFTAPIAFEANDLEDMENGTILPHFIYDYMREFPGFPLIGGSEKFEIEVTWSDDYGEF